MLSCQINNVSHLWSFADCCIHPQSIEGLYCVWTWAEWNLQWSDDETALLGLHMTQLWRQPKLNCRVTWAGFSLTPYLESFTPTFGLGTPVFPRISSNLHCGTPTFSKRCLLDSYFQNPSENSDEYWPSKQVFMAQKIKTRWEKKAFILFKIQPKKPLFYQNWPFKKKLYFQKSLLEANSSQPYMTFHCSQPFIIICPLS